MAEPGLSSPATGGWQSTRMMGEPGAAALVSWSEEQLVKVSRIMQRSIHSPPLHQLLQTCDARAGLCGKHQRCPAARSSRCGCSSAAASCARSTATTCIDTTRGAHPCYTTPVPTCSSSSQHGASAPACVVHGGGVHWRGGGRRSVPRRCHRQRVSAAAWQPRQQPAGDAAVTGGRFCPGAGGCVQVGARVCVGEAWGGSEL